MRVSMATAELTPSDRVISIEDTMELQSNVRNCVDLRAIGQVTIFECLRASMRLIPTLIVVGEVRGTEAHTLLKAWNTGHPAGVAWIHTNDARVGGRVWRVLLPKRPRRPNNT
jgi:Flp pilus assembly CpaF family ATPase